MDTGGHSDAIESGSLNHSDGAIASRHLCSLSNFAGSVEHDHIRLLLTIKSWRDVLNSEF
jgi:hypothetical protein